MSVYRREDPIDDWDAYCEDEEKEIAKLPTCDKCGERIMDDTLFEVDGYLYCEDCMRKMFEVYTWRHMTA